MPPRNVQFVRLSNSLDASDASPSYGCLITLANPEAAAQLVAALKLDDSTLGHIHLVPVNPDMPLPPPMVDPKVAQSILQGLQNAQQDLETHGVRQEMTTTTSNTTTTTTNVMNQTQEQNDQDMEDPLTTLAVLSAVQKFRESLAAQQGSKAIRRQELVQQHLDAAVERIRQQGGILPPPGPPPPPERHQPRNPENPSQPPWT